MEIVHSLAHDLAERLLPAFDKTDTGIPFPRVNLRHGLPEVAQFEKFFKGGNFLAGWPNNYLHCWGWLPTARVFSPLAAFGRPNL